MLQMGKEPVGTGLKLSVPIFTGFVMLPNRKPRRGSFASCSFSPLFYGIRDVTGGGDWRQDGKMALSVPYFTGFVMLRAGPEARALACRSFSPLFYGIRDVTWLELYKVNPIHFFQSYFTGFVMLPEKYSKAAVKNSLSVPYFTGFVMLQERRAARRW